MADEEHLKILKQGVEVWNRWREENPVETPDLDGADLSGANLGEADLRGVNLMGADLRGADLREANLGVMNLVESNPNRGRGIMAFLSEANLSEADLSEANLYGAGLGEATLTRATLTKADLSGALLGWADLSEADLRGAVLFGADLIMADLSGANLYRATLIRADLSGANLSGANLSEAAVGQTLFADLDLSEVEGLETINHDGPSTIGIETIYRSKGKIPEVFLRGCGVQDSFITYMGSLTGEAIQYYSCFISHSSKDEDFAQRLHNDLQGKGVRCWFAPEDVRAGRKLYEQIDQAIRLHDKLLLVLSDNSIRSEWVMTEIRRARKAEIRDERRKLFPVSLADWQTIKDWECFDADLGKDLAVEVREYFVPDFSKWKEHNSYQQAFDRLLRDLKASEA